MRSPISFDTLEYMDELKKSGMKQEEAEAITKATAKAFTQMMETKELATKSDIKTLELALRKDMKELEIALTKYINDNNYKIIGTLATIQAIILGLFGVIQHFVK